MKKLLLLLAAIFFIFIDVSSAIKISPTQTILATNQYETNCTNIWVLPHENFTITSRWSINGGGNLTKYNLDAKKAKLEINYSYLSEGKYIFCFTPNRVGNLSGIVYFYSEKTLVEIGSWIDLKVAGTGPIERISLVTMNTIKGYDANETNVWFGIIFALLLVILVIVVKKYLR
jgi:hypothetical protein